MNEPDRPLHEYAAAHDAARYLEAGDPARALTVLRGLHLESLESPQDLSAAQLQTLRLQQYLERAIHEIEKHYPGHALRTLRVAMGRAPLG